MPEVEPAPVLSRPDYRNLSQYRHMLELDRAGWAWEWLRRNPDYERACGEDATVAERQAPDTLSGAIVLQSTSACLSPWGVCFRRGGGVSCRACAPPLGCAPRAFGAPRRNLFGCGRRSRRLRSSALFRDSDRGDHTRGARASRAVRRLSPNPDRC